MYLYLQSSYETDTREESWNPVVESTYFFMSCSQPLVPLFYSSYFFSPSSVSDECRFRSSERRNFTRAQSFVPYILLSRDGKYESVTVIRIFWTVPSSRSLFSTIICSHACPFITSGIFLRRLFAAKHANGKSESLKSLFAGRTDVLE